jgi:drug/metabolite transporter (DMT)-like permease
MLHLLAVSLIWAFSFGLIKRHLAGVDSTFVTAARLGLALLVFAPFLRVGALRPRLLMTLAAIGAVQFGLMYLAYIESFRYLRAYEAALFTITTPVFVTLFADALDARLRPRALAAALLAVVGTMFVLLRPTQLELTLIGFGLVQLSNAAFAVGQVWYRRLRARETTLRDRDVFGILYAGAFVLAVTVMLARGGWTVPTATQSATLLYLGILASGVGFFLWNVGATRVNAGVLAVMNNLKIPLAVAVSLLFFGEKANLPVLLVSLATLALAVWLAEKKPAP